MKSLSTVIKGLGLARIRLWNQLQSLRTLVLSEPMHSRLVGDSYLINVRPAKCSTEWLEQWKKGHPKIFFGILVKGIISQIHLNECPAKFILKFANHPIHHCTGKRWSVSIIYLVDTRYVVAIYFIFCTFCLKKIYRVQKSQSQNP